MKKETNQKVSAIVCAYNEEETIRNVVEPLAISNLVDEIILVDDGSKDDTAALLLSYQSLEKIHLILLPENRGKGYAMASASSVAKGEILFFIDADLMNLNSTHIHSLLGPIINQEVDMVMGTPVREERISLSNRLDPFRILSGQRVVYRDDFLPLLDKIQCSGYGVETIINLYFREQRKTVSSIFLPNLHHPIKIEKTGLHQSLAEYLKEGKDILITLFNNPDLVFGALFGGVLQ